MEEFKNKTVKREKAHYLALDPDPSINKESNYEKL
jgi:hypothetical protein